MHAKLSASCDNRTQGNHFGGFRSGKADCISIITNSWLITPNHVQSQANFTLSEEKKGPRLQLISFGFVLFLEFSVYFSVLKLHICMFIVFFGRRRNLCNFLTDGTLIAAFTELYSELCAFVINLAGVFLCDAWFPWSCCVIAM